MWIGSLGITYHMMFWNKTYISSAEKKKKRKCPENLKAKHQWFLGLVLTKNLNQLHSMGKKGMEVSLSSASWGCSEENKKFHSGKCSLRICLSYSPSGFFRIRGDTKLLLSKSVCDMIVQFMCRSGDCLVKRKRNWQKLEANRRTELKHKT